MKESRDSEFLENPAALNYPWFDSPFLEQQLEATQPEAGRAEMVRRYRDDGYLILDGFFEPELIDSVRERYDWLFDGETQFEASPEILHRLELDTKRRQDAWAVCPPVRELACHARMMELLRFLYGRDPIPFQTLNFLPGSSQSMHSDHFHFASVPAGFMCGVWVALEDVTLENGPLLYAQGSHRYPRTELADLRLWSDRQELELGKNYGVYEAYLQALIRARDPKVETLTCPKGTVVIWASNLLHGGAPILDPESTRKSQVTHYFFEDCICYRPVHSDTALGEYSLIPVRDIRTGEIVPPRLNGHELRTQDVGYRDAELYRVLRQAADTGSAAPDPIGKLEREQSRLREHIAIVEAECMAQVAHIDTIDRESEARREHIVNLENIMSKIHGHTLYRVAGNLRRALGFKRK